MRVWNARAIQRTPSRRRIRVRIVAPLTAIHQALKKRFGELPISSANNTVHPDYSSVAASHSTSMAELISVLRCTAKSIAASILNFKGAGNGPRFQRHTPTN
jgi:hypothetical protein